MIARISTFLSESTLLFITLSIFSILSFTILLPHISSIYSRGEDRMLDGWGYGYRISVIKSVDSETIFYNYGREINGELEIYLNGSIYAGDILVWNGSSWVNSPTIPKSSLFKISQGIGPDEDILIIIDGRYLVRPEVN